MKVINGFIRNYHGERVIDGVSLKSDLIWWWPLESSLASKSGGITGVETHAGTNRTRVNPDTGLIEAVGANVARFEEVGGHRALLIEPEGVNLVTYSEAFDDAAWNKVNSSITANATTAPGGTVTADKLVEASDTSQAHYIRNTISATSITSDSDVTFSVYLKPAERTWVYLQLRIKDNSYVAAYFNLSTGTVGAESVDDYGSEPAANGFRRYWITHNVGTGASDLYFNIRIAVDDSTSSYNGDGTSGIYVWGEQVEESPVPTSYIKTAGGTATRATESGEPHFTLPPGLFDDHGTALVWWRPGYGYGDISGFGKGIITTANSGYGLMQHQQGSLVSSYDGSAYAHKGLSWSANTWYKLIAKWGYLVGGVEKFRLGVDSGSGVVWGTEQDFDGSYTIGTYLSLGYGLFGPMHLRNLMLFDTVLTDAEINQRGGTP